MGEMKAEVVYANVVQAAFVRRLNRFSANVLLDGHEETVHVKNTGRLGELLLPGAAVTLQKASNPARKTAYDLISVYKPGLEWVNIDSLAPNLLMKRYLMGVGTFDPDKPEFRDPLMDRYLVEVGTFDPDKPEFRDPLMRRCLAGAGAFDLVKPEFTIGDSRIDFYAERGNDKYLHEVKGCTLAHDIETGIGMFPDAPTERGVRHLHELAKASKEGYKCSVDFVIQMNGIHLVLPNDLTQPEFGLALAEAVRDGVQVNCFSTCVEADRIRIVGVKDCTAQYIK